jgi:hypothetical protein
MAILHASPTTTSATDDHGVGNIFDSPDGKKYKWVKIADAVDLATGYVLTPASTDGTEYTADITSGSSKATRGVGIALGAVDVSATPYCFMQIAGVATVYTDGGVSAGEAVIAQPDVDGQADTMADGEEEQVFGFALADDSGSPTTAPVYLLGNF